MTTFAIDDYAAIRARVAELATERELLTRPVPVVCTCAERYAVGEAGMPTRVIGGYPPPGGCAKHGGTAWGVVGEDDDRNH